MLHAASPARRALRATGYTFLCAAAACADNDSALPFEPSATTEPRAVWSPTLRVLNGTSFRLLELRDPLQLGAPQEKGTTLFGDAALARFNTLRGGTAASTGTQASVTQSSQERLRLLGSSRVHIDHTMANFLTTSTITTVDPDEYIVGLLTQQAQHYIGLQGRSPTSPFTRSATFATNQDALLQTRVTSWPGIDVGARCPVSAEERATHHLEAGRVDFWRFTQNEPKDAHSWGADEVHRPCFDAPDDFCNTMNYCGDNDSDGPPGGPSSGAGTAVEGQVFITTAAGWSNKYCWVTDYYDSEKRYLDTQVNWCNF